MSIIEDTYTLFIREMLIFKKNIGTNIARGLIFPLVFIILLGAFGSAPKNVPVALVNYDNSAASLNFINMLQSGGSIVVTSDTTQPLAMSELSSGQVAAVVVIPAGFSNPQGSSSIYTYLDNSQPQSAGVVSGVVEKIAAQFNVKSLTGATAPQAGADPISVVANYAYGAGSNYESFVVGGIIIMVAAFGAMFGSGFTVISDRQLGNLKTFLTTPINKYSILLSKIAYGTVQSSFSAYIGLAIGLLYGATIAAGLLGFIELLWIILLVGLGFGALSVAMATRAKQLQTYALISQTITMPLAFLGGAFVPVTLLPSFLRPVSVVNPLTYAVDATRDIMIKGYLPLSTLLLASAILLAFAVAMIALAVMFFRDTSRQI
ncbi:MAG: ABC transporter permease [Candidatus Micrarchaeota archaeon]|nr:ABC transporter permease [Candidatus Micrarchaeota archaeon]